MKPEHLVQPGQLLGTGVVKVEPEEVIALQVVVDARLVDLGEARRHEAELALAVLRGHRGGLTDSHGRLLGLAAAEDIVAAGAAVVSREAAAGKAAATRGRS